MGLYHVDLDIDTDLINGDLLADFLADWLNCDMLNSAEVLRITEI